MFRLILCVWALIGSIGFTVQAEAKYEGEFKQSKAKLSAIKVGAGFERPVGAFFMPGDDRYMFVIEQHTGKIFVCNVRTKKRARTPILHLTDLATSNEQGLLGFAFHPDFKKNRYVFVHYNRSDGDTIIERYTLSKRAPYHADVKSKQLVLHVKQPREFHQGGWIGFGKGGYLYIALGDGDGDIENMDEDARKLGNSLDRTNNLLGKILRIDVNRDDFKDDPRKNYGIPKSNPYRDKKWDSEIWAYGLRNPWQCSFDMKTGDLYIGDVGNDKYEEINFIKGDSKGGVNFGWRFREGYGIPNDYFGRPKTRDMVDPILVYGHHHEDDVWGLSIAGGVVYRGKAVPRLDGHYFFADIISKQIYSIKYDRKSKRVRQVVGWTKAIKTDDGMELTSPVAFAQDSKGEIYIVNHAWNIYKLVPRK